MTSRLWKNLRSQYLVRGGDISILFAIVKAILQLAECGTFFQVDLWGKLAFTDAYEDPYGIPQSSVLLVAHDRVLLLQVCQTTPL